MEIFINFKVKMVKLFLTKVNSHKFLINLIEYDIEVNKETLLAKTLPLD